MSDDTRRHPSAYDLSQTPEYTRLAAEHGMVDSDIAREALGEPETPAPLLTDRQREYLVLILLLAAFGFLTLAFVNGSFVVNAAAILALLLTVAAAAVADPLRRRGRR